MIRLLEKNVADKIAAGEVIERPLSVVKELVENSIDSGAGSITVEIKNGGKSYIRVTDDGSGIPETDVEKAFLRHATSKLEKAEDLLHVSTLGFRGEALASIAAVSRISVITKTSGEKVGTRLEMEGGNRVYKGACGCETGTTVIATDLFYNLPVRKKFMGSDSGEASLIIDLVSKIALAYKDIKVRMINNEINLFTTAGPGGATQGWTKTVLNNIAQIYGRNMADGLLPVQASAAADPSLSLTGFISKPEFAKTGRRFHIFFVNGRNISDKIMEKALEEGYSDKLTSGKTPAAFLFLSIDPSKIDVNIHPNKREIRFSDVDEIRDFLYNSVRAVLTSPEAATKPPEKPGQYKFETDLTDQPAKQMDMVDIKKLFTTIREDQTASYNNEMLPEETLYPPKYEEDEATTEVNEPVKSLVIKEVPEILGVVFNTYIICKTSEGIHLVDQHAAHERIFFEELERSFSKEQKHLQQLLKPLILTVSPGVKEGLDENAVAFLERYGFEIEDFGPGTFKINGIPTFMNMGEALGFLEYYMENFGQGEFLKDSKKREQITMRACKTAVKGGDRLSFQEISELLENLMACENPYNCPHGRPTIVKFSQKDLDRMFKRV